MVGLQDVDALRRVPRPALRMGQAQFRCIVVAECDKTSRRAKIGSIPSRILNIAVDAIVGCVRDKLQRYVASQAGLVAKSARQDIRFLGNNQNTISSR